MGFCIATMFLTDHVPDSGKGNKHQINQRPHISGFEPLVDMSQRGNDKESGVHTVRASTASEGGQEAPAGSGE